MARILIVEDEPAIQAILRALVEGAGHQAAVASDVVEARLLASHEAAAMFVDVSLPGGADGIDFVRELRGGALHSRTPIVVMTGNPGAARALSGIEVVTKPFRFAEVLAIIRRLVGSG